MYWGPYWKCFMKHFDLHTSMRLFWAAVFQFPLDILIWLQCQLTELSSCSSFPEELHYGSIFSHFLANTGIFLRSRNLNRGEKMTATSWEERIPGRDRELLSSRAGGWAHSGMNGVPHVRAEQFLVLHSFLCSIPNLGRGPQHPSCSVLFVFWIHIFYFWRSFCGRHFFAWSGSEAAQGLLVADLNLMLSALKPEIFRVQIESFPVSCTC